MHNPYRNVKEWGVALETAAWSLLAQQPEGDPAAQVSVELCLKHGPHCACVTYGVLLDHFVWSEHDPEQLAVHLVEMITSAAS
jgi:hypothetical protein